MTSTSQRLPVYLSAIKPVSVSLTVRTVSCNSEHCECASDFVGIQ